jgi:predicted DNA-binding transcriptional regulator
MGKTKLFQSDKIPFTQVANAVLDDKTISFNAKGVYAHLMAKPEGWDFSTERIAMMSKDGERAVRSAIQEREMRGLLTRRRLVTGRVDYILNKVPPCETADGGNARAK